MWAIPMTRAGIDLERIASRRSSTPPGGPCVFDQECLCSPSVRPLLVRRRVLEHAIVRRYSVAQRACRMIWNRYPDTFDIGPRRSMVCAHYANGIWEPR